jgi:RNA polymerase sigma factor (sigma-70 family)
LKSGDLAAVEALWQRYASSLVALARHRLRGVSTSYADEDDIAQSVFHNVCRGAAAGRFTGVQNRDELWWLLLSITKRKVVDHIRRETAIKRGGGSVLSETALASNSVEGSPFSFDLLVADEPTPEFLVALDEQTQRILGLLRDDRLREIAIARIEGFTVAEIADNLAISARSVERKLQLIRKTWSADLARGN